MKTVVCTKLGDPNLLRIKDVKKPTPSKEEVIIKVEAAGINFPDALLVQGKYQVVLDPPFTPGNEICGLIDEVGENVDFKIGTKVIGLPEIGGFSEYVAINKNLVIPINSSLSSIEAASLPINYGTSYYALKRRANIKKGETILILGAAGGIGTATIQLSKILGVKTICAVSNQEKEEYVKNLGADQVIRYDKFDLKDEVKKLTNGNGVDVVMDPVGGNVTEQALRATAWNGRLLIVGFTDGNIPKVPLNLTLVKGVSIIGVWWGRWTMLSPNELYEDFEELLNFVENESLKIVPNKIYSINDVPKALEKFVTRKNIGKSVVKF